MKITIEISMYPFEKDYKPPIKGFIDRLNTYPGLQCSTSATSTIVSGEYAYVMQVLTEMLAWSYEEFGRAVYVTKLIPGYQAE